MNKFYRLTSFLMVNHFLAANFLRKREAPYKPPRIIIDKSVETPKGRVAAEEKQIRKAIEIAKS